MRPLVLLCLSLAAVSAHAASPATTAKLKPDPNPSPVNDRFSLRASYFAGKVATDLTLDSTAGLVGTPLSAEDDLGLSKKASQGRIEIIFRLHDKHRWRIDYAKVSRNGDRRLTRQLVVGNNTYNLNDRVESLLDWRTLGFTYSYSVLRRDNYEIGLGAGLTIMNAEARGNVLARNIREDGTGVGALPTLNLDGTFAFARRWSVGGHIQAFSASVSSTNTDISGKMSDIHFDVQYRWRPNFAVGLGYSAYKFDVDVKSADQPGRFKLDTKGPELFFRTSF